MKELSDLDLRFGFYISNYPAVTVLSYLPQFTPPPSLLLETERKLVHRYLKLPMNTLRQIDTFAMGDFNGPAVRSATITAFASLARAALDTLDTWKFWHTKMKEVAENHLNFQRIVVQNKPWPDHWNFDSFASSLFWAASGFAGDRSLEKAFSDAVVDIQARKAANEHHKVRAQGVFYKHIMQHKLPPNLSFQILKKAAVISGEAMAFDDIDFEKYQKTLGFCSTFVATCALRTVLNGWNTSRRHHDHPIRRCVFGCSAEDAQDHYIECVPLWNAISTTLLPLPAPSTKTARIGISQISVLNVQFVATSYLVYHAAKHHSPITNRNPEPDREVLAAFLEKLPNFVRAAKKQIS